MINRTILIWLLSSTVYGTKTLLYRALVWSAVARLAYTARPPERSPNAYVSVVRFPYSLVVARARKMLHVGLRMTPSRQQHTFANVRWCADGAGHVPRQQVKSRRSGGSSKHLLFRTIPLAIH